MLVDSFGRRIDYLRLSVTDRCDLRCTYCMPPEFKGYEDPAHWMTLEETARIARIFVGLGVHRVRLTGGEPLLRGRFGDLVQMLGIIDGLNDLSLSTNGTQLARYAGTLKASGVSRLNVSLDTLSRTRFVELAKRDALPDVLAGLEAAKREGFELIKINMVWIPEVNGNDLDPMVEFCRSHGFVLRLIENMPMGDAARKLGSPSLQPVIDDLRQRHGLIDKVISGGGPARYLASPDGQFTIGFITPVSQHFCDACNRVRMSVSGTLHLCLGQEQSLELLPMLRGGASDDDLAQAIQDAVARKPWRHDFNERPEKIIRIMSATGG
jgi:GTP 3',8-cyclase